jgi:hypothetical protein
MDAEQIDLMADILGGLLGEDAKTMLHEFDAGDDTEQNKEQDTTHKHAFRKYSEQSKGPTMPLPETPVAEAGAADNTEQMIQALTELGFDPNILKKAPPEVLADIVRVQQEADRSYEEGDKPTEETPPTEGTEGEQPPPEPPVEEHAEDDDEELEKMMDRYLEENPEKAEKYMAKYAHKHGEADMPADAIPAAAESGAGGKTQIHIHKETKKGAPRVFSEKQINSLVSQAVTEAMKPIKQKMAKVDKFAEDRLAAEKKAATKARIDVFSEQGKILPAEKEDLLAAALTLDSSTVIRKFKEKRDGKLIDVEHTAYDRFMAALDKRPNLVSFSERIKTQGGGTEAAEDNEVQKVEAHVQKFSESFARAGMDAKAVVAGFKNERKLKNGKLTAEEFLGT